MHIAVLFEIIYLNNAFARLLWSLRCANLHCVSVCVLAARKLEQIRYIFVIHSFNKRPYKMFYELPQIDTLIQMNERTIRLLLSPTDAVLHRKYDKLLLISFKCPPAYRTTRMVFSGFHSTCAWTIWDCHFEFLTEIFILLSFSFLFCDLKIFNKMLIYSHSVIYAIYRWEQIKLKQICKYIQLNNSKKNNLLIRKSLTFFAFKHKHKRKKSVHLRVHFASSRHANDTDNLL